MFNKFKCMQPTIATIVETNLHTKNKYKEKRKYQLEEQSN